MNNIDLFEFPFVDRIDESKRFKQFMNDSNQNILWINGDSGVGKSSFVKQMEQNIKDREKIRLYIPPLDENKNSLFLLIEELQKISNLKLLDFIKQNYHCIFDIIKQSTLGLPGNETFWNIAFDTSKIFVSYSKEKQNVVKVICKYIDKLLIQKNMYIEIDNFMYCDEKSAEILMTIFKHYTNNYKIKFILITTTDKLEKRKDIKNFLTTRVLCEYMLISPLNKSRFFVQILTSIIEINQRNLEKVCNNIFILCKGNPEQLKILLQNLLLNEEISFTSKDVKAHLNVHALKKYIIKENVSFEINKLSFIEKFVLQILVEFDKNISLDLLQRNIQYLFIKIFMTNDYNLIDFYNSINRLEELNIIENHNQILFFSHDQIYYSLKEYFDKNILQAQINFYMLNFLDENADAYSKNGITDDEIDYFRSKFSWVAKTDNWVDINYQYGLELFQKNLYSNSSIIFNRLHENLENFSCEQKFVIARCYYEAGDYESSRQIFIFIDTQQLRDDILFSYYYFLGKVNNILMDKHKAINNFNYALEYANSTNQEIMVPNLKQLAMREISEQREQAKEVYDYAISLINESDYNNSAVCALLRNCMNYYKHEDAESYFEGALAIAQSINSEIDIAFVLNNRGFTYLKNGRVSDAKEDFEKAIKILQNTKFHESSYPLVNLALCNMFESSFESALSILYEAYLWNQSPYADYVINTNMLTCYRMLGNLQEGNKIANYLYDLLISDVIIDSTIIRKIGINTALFFEYIGTYGKAQQCIEIAYPYVHKTSSENRMDIIRNRICYETRIDTKLPFCDYYSICTFEPWGLTLSHD